MTRTMRLSVGIVIAALMANTVAPQPTASADPPILPFVPGPPLVPLTSGAPTYQYYRPITPPRATTDTRGVRSGVMAADTSQTNVSMPGSAPGAGLPNQVLIQNFANIRAGIQGGVTPPPMGAAPAMGFQVGPSPVTLENPAGQPPAEGYPAPEMVNQAPPVYPQLERPDFYEER